MPLPNKPLLDRGASSVWLERERRLSQSNQLANSPDFVLRRSQKGTSIHLARRFGGGGGRVKQYLLTDATNGDYFIARALSVSVDVSDPEALPALNIGATDIYIAKPFHLRQSAFDRDTLNAANPGNIGTPSEITYDIQVEVWNGSSLDIETRRLSFAYKSATFRIATDETSEDPDNWPTERQTIIPRFVPADLIEPEPEAEEQTITLLNFGATIIYAIPCAGLGVIRPVDPDDPFSAQVPVSLLALNDGWAWAKT